MILDGLLLKSIFQLPARKPGSREDQKTHGILMEAIDPPPNSSTIDNTIDGFLPTIHNN